MAQRQRVSRDRSILHRRADRDRRAWLEESGLGRVKTTEENEQCQHDVHSPDGAGEDHTPPECRRFQDNQSVQVLCHSRKTSTRARCRPETELPGPDRPRAAAAPNERRGETAAVEPLNACHQCSWSSASRRNMPASSRYSDASRIAPTPNRAARPAGDSANDTSSKLPTDARPHRSRQPRRITAASGA